MGFLGLLVYLVCIGASLFLGYEADFQIIFLLLLPIGFMVGRVIIQGSKSSTIFRSTGFGILLEILGFYLVGLILTVVFFGIGYGIMEILKLSPES